MGNSWNLGGYLPIMQILKFLAIEQAVIKKQNVLVCACNCMAGCVESISANIFRENI